MSAVQHTPGPWVVAVGDDGYTEVRTQDDGSGPYFISAVHGGLRETAANARLIAAAPDLRKAAALALHLLRELTEEGDLDPAESVILGREELTVTRTLHELQTALAKAEGWP